MKFLFDFFPIVLFFIAYKIFGIYIATAIAIIASLLQVIIFRLKYQKFDKFQIVSFLIILILGSATIFFHNPVFIKWKPTGIYWITSLVFLITTFFGKKTLVQRIMESNLKLPSNAWKKLNLMWSVFFMLMGFANLYVAYYYSTNVWVNFKLFGGMSFTIIFVLLQALYLNKYINNKSLKKQGE